MFLLILRLSCDQRVTTYFVRVFWVKSSWQNLLRNPLFDNGNNEGFLFGIVPFEEVGEWILEIVGLIFRPSHLRYVHVKNERFSVKLHWKLLCSELWWWITLLRTLFSVSVCPTTHPLTRFYITKWDSARSSFYQ